MRFRERFGQGVRRNAFLIVAAAVSAALLWAVFAPLNEITALPFAVAPLLAVSRLVSARRAAWTWFASGFACWFATLAWMPAIVKNGGPWPLVVLGWMGLAAVCAGYFALFGALSACLWRRAEGWGFGGRLFALVVGEPVLWAGIEWLRATLFTGFAWNFLGTAVGAAPSMALSARFGGVYLVSALVVLVNGVFATLLLRIVAQMRGKGLPGPRALRTLETAVPLALTLVCTVGAQHDHATAAQATAFRPLRVALVQRNAPCVFTARDPNDNPWRAFERLLGTARAAQVDLIVWAESAMAEFGRVDAPGALRAADHFMRSTGAAALLAGGDWRQAGRVYNAAALYTPAATNAPPTCQVYAKQHLVPFGEYIPFDKWIPALQKLSPIGVSCWPGEAKVLELPGRDGASAVKLAPLICYEDTDPVLARRGAALGAQAIVLVTNDSWFSRSREAEQHAAQAVLRALETGLPVLRTGNSGVTGLILPDGTTRWLEEKPGRPLVDAPGTLVESVLVAETPARTVYTRLGDVPLGVLSVLVVGALFFPRRRLPRS